MYVNNIRELNRELESEFEERRSQQSCPEEQNEMTTETFLDVFRQACSRHAPREFLRTKKTGQFRRKQLEELRWSGVLQKMTDHNLNMVCSCNGLRKRASAAAIKHINELHTKGDELYNMNEITFWKK